MQVTRFADAKPYEAPKHHAMTGLRLQGWDVSDSQNFWVGMSQFLPVGGAEMDASPLEKVYLDASPLEKVYLVLSGEVTIILENGEETVLGPKDSCFIGPDEGREIINRTNETVHMLVILNYPEGAR